MDIWITGSRDNYEITDVYSVKPQRGSYTCMVIAVWGKAVLKVLGRKDDTVDLMPLGVKKYKQMPSEMANYQEFFRAAGNEQMAANRLVKRGTYTPRRRSTSTAEDKSNTLMEDEKKDREKKGLESKNCRVVSCTWPGACSPKTSSARC